MIQIFNGRSRALGQDAQDAVYLQVSVTLRQHLHHFKGARLGVFMAIALHSNAEGWAWPSLAILRSETGYNVQTISQALSDLCVLTIDGHRVLLSVQDRAVSGTFATNRYLLFPSDEDVARYAGEEDSQARPPLDVPLMATPQVAQPSTEKPSTAAPLSAKAHERRTMGNKNHGEQEPARERTRRVASLPAGQSSAIPPPPAEHPAITAYRTTFGRSPTDRQATAIANTVTDITRWTRVLDDWQANAWRAESVGKMLDRYDHHVEEHSYAAPSDRRAHADGRPRRPSAAPTPEELARFLNRQRPGHGQASA